MKLEPTVGPNEKLLGYQPEEAVADYLQRAKALIFAAEDDFGIPYVEAQAAGCPMIAYDKGRVLDVVGWPAPKATGIFFDDQTPEALGEATNLFETHEDEFKPDACRRHAERFGQQRFQSEFRSTVDELWRRFQRGEKLE